MKALKVLIIILAAFCAIAFLLPKEFTVTKNIKINAPLKDVFEQVNTLSNWIYWSAWHEMDPDANYNYSASNSGVGASYSWDGDPEIVGAGTLTILESTKNRSIRTETIFLQDGIEKGRGNGDWEFTEENGVTRVSWSFLGDMGNNPVARWIGLMMDRMLGPKLEKGLNNMKKYLENQGREEALEQLSTDSTSLD